MCIMRRLRTFTAWSSASRARSPCNSSTTPTHVHPALRALGLRQKELHRRFNWRGDEPVPSHLVLNHSPRIKEDALTKYEEKKKEWEARAAERRALEAPPSPPRKKRRRRAKKEEL